MQTVDSYFPQFYACWNIMVDSFKWVKPLATCSPYLITFLLMIFSEKMNIGSLTLHCSACACTKPPVSDDLWSCDNCTILCHVTLCDSAMSSQWNLLCMMQVWCVCCNVVGTWWWHCQASATTTCHLFIVLPSACHTPVSWRAAVYGTGLCLSCSTCMTPAGYNNMSLQ